MSRIQEYISSHGEQEIDEENGIIRGVKILGIESRNGYRYTSDCCAKAAKLYEGRTVNLDHRMNRTGRPLCDHFGELKNVRFVENVGLFGDLHYLKNHHETPVIIERAKRMPSHFGLSHDADGTKVMRESGTIIEELHDVFSVDLVLRPATNKSLFESDQTEPKPMAKVKTTLGTIYAKNQKPSWQRERLCEMMTAPEIGENMEVEVEEDDSPEAQLKKGLLAAINKKLADADAATLKKVMKDLGIADSLTELNGSGSGSGGDSGGDGGSSDTQVKESELHDQVRYLMAENKLHRSGKKFDKKTVQVLARLNESEQEHIISNLPDLQNQAGSSDHKPDGSPYKMPTYSPSILREGTENSESEFERLLEAEGKNRF